MIFTISWFDCCRLSFIDSSIVTSIVTADNRRRYLQYKYRLYREITYKLANCRPIVKLSHFHLACHGQSGITLWGSKPPVGMHRDIFCPNRFFSIPIERRARGSASAFQNGAEVLQCVQTYRPGPTYETPRRPPVEIELVILEKRLRNGWRKRQVTLVILHKARP